MPLEIIIIDQNKPDFLDKGVNKWQGKLPINHLRVDFSLEHMFPNNDPERQFYEEFREEFSREDDIILLTYAGIPVLERASKLIPLYNPQKHSKERVTKTKL